MKHKLHYTLLQNMAEAERLLKNLVRYEEERLLEVYTDEAYDKRVKDINQKINELITELQK